VANPAGTEAKSRTNEATVGNGSAL
jgi:hypothetical protein